MRVKFKLPLFLKAYFSPFKPLKLVFYAGKIKKGVPHFYPRRWVKFNKGDIEKAINEAMNNERLIKKSYDEWVKQYTNYTKPIPKKIGFDFVDIGWKTKFGDYRFEFAPIWSFVFSKWQFTVSFIAPHQDHYWECFLYYHFETDKLDSAEERIEQCKKEYPCIWTRYIDGEKETIDYYQHILRDKFLK